jgi:DNA repair photolyase
MPSEAAVHSVSAIVVLANSNENNLTTAGIKTTRKVSDLTKHRSISKHQKPSFHKTNHPTYDLNNQLIPIVACEHGCIYCFARPSHAYLDLLLGLDFETKVTAKTPAADILKKQLLSPNYQCKPISLGVNTDPYRPI